MMRGRQFLSYVNVNDEPARDAPQSSGSNVHLQAGKRRFTTAVNINDDLRRELDPLDGQPSWDGFRGTASVNGLPLYAPAQYLARSATMSTQAPPARTATIVSPVVRVSDGAKVAPPAAAGGVTVERVDVWPWWIWPLAAAAAVAVRGS